MGKSFGDLETVYKDYIQKDNMIGDLYLQIKELNRTKNELEDQTKSLKKALERRLVKEFSDVFMQLENTQIVSVILSRAFWSFSASSYKMFTVLFDDADEAIHLVQSKKFALEPLEEHKYRLRPLGAGEEVLKEV